MQTDSILAAGTLSLRRGGKNPKTLLSKEPLPLLEAEAWADFHINSLNYFNVSKSLRQKLYIWHQIIPHSDSV